MSRNPLPIDGILSWNRNASSNNSPQNFAGGTGSVDASGGGGAVCGNSSIEAGEDRDEGNANGTAGSCCASDCTTRPAGDICRASAGVCDVAEVYNGSNAICPANTFELVTTECRGSQGASTLPTSAMALQQPARPTRS